MFATPPMTRVVRNVLVALAAAVLVSILGERLFGRPVFALLALSSRAGLHTLWQLVTHPFAVPVSGGGVIQAILGGLFFYWMGAPLELRIGSRRFALLLGAMTVASGVAGLAIGWLLGPWSSAAVVAYGLSPILLGTLVALALSYPPHALLRPFGLFAVRRNALIAGFVGLAVLLDLADGRLVALFGDLSAAGVAALFMRNRQAPAYRVRPPAPSQPAQYWRGRKL